MKVLGITGGVGSGKSEVLRWLEDAYGAYVCQMDETAKELQKKGTDCYRQIADHFGSRVVGRDGELDRAELSRIVNRCVKALQEAADELKNFKKPDSLRALLVKVNDIEIEADNVYTDAIYRLFRSSSDVKALLGAKAIYESLEHCCDLCEHAADVIEQVIIKNS